MIFWLVAAIMTAVVVAFLIAPLLRRRDRNDMADAAKSSGAASLAVYRDQLGEIDRDLAAGVLSADQADAARREVQRRLLAAAEDSKAARTSKSSDRPLRWPALLVVVTLPLTVLGLYVAFGSPGIPSQPFAERAPAGNDLIDLTARADGLARRLVAEDGPAEDWALLGRTLAQLERFPQAAEAIRQAIAKGLDGPQIRVFLGEVLVAANQGRVTQEAREAFAWTLENEPANPYALYYAGLALAQDGRTQQAFDLWVSLARASPPEAPWLQPLGQQIAAAAQDLGVAMPDLTAPNVATPNTLVPGDVASGDAAPNVAAPAGDSAPPGPSQAEVEAAAEMTPEERDAFVRSMVDRLASRLDEEPNDLEGWLRLGRAYLVLGDTDDARMAIEKATPLVEALPQDAPQRAALKALAETLDALAPQ